MTILKTLKKFLIPAFIWICKTKRRKILGEVCREFENKFSKYIKSKYCVSVNSWTSGL